MNEDPTPPAFHPRCPICAMLVDPVSASRYLPFCSERCRLIDLGRWLKEEHAVPCEKNPDDTDSQQSTGSAVNLPPGWHDA